LELLIWKSSFRRSRCCRLASRFSNGIGSKRQARKPGPLEALEILLAYCLGLFVEVLRLIVDMVLVLLPRAVCGERSWVEHEGGEETLPCLSQSFGLQPALATFNLCLKLARNGLKHPRTSHSAVNPLSSFEVGCHRLSGPKPRRRRMSVSNRSSKAAHATHDDCRSQ